MAVDAHANLAYSTVATAPSPATSGTSLVVASGEGARFPAVPFNATIWPTGTIPTPANAEIVRVTNISTDTLTITRTQESTSARTVVVGDQIAATITAKTLTDIESYLTGEAATRGTTGSIASTYDRGLFAGANAAELSTGRLSVYRIFLPKGLTCTSITFRSATTALSVGTNQWFALFDSAGAMLRVTADDTSTAWAANSAKTLNLSSTFVTTYAGLYYVGIMVKATTVPTLEGLVLFGNAGGQNPKVGGSADTSLTNPASCPNPFTFANSTRIVYAEVS